MCPARGHVEMTNLGMLAFDWLKGKRAISKGSRHVQILCLLPDTEVRADHYADNGYQGCQFIPQVWPRYFIFQTTYSISSIACIAHNVILSMPTRFVFWGEVDRLVCPYHCWDQTCVLDWPHLQLNMNHYYLWMLCGCLFPSFIKHCVYGSTVPDNIFRFHCMCNIINKSLLFIQGWLRPSRFTAAPCSEDRNWKIKQNKNKTFNSIKQITAIQVNSVTYKTPQQSVLQGFSTQCLLGLRRNVKTWNVR